MRKDYLSVIGAALMLAIGISSCSSDDEDISVIDTEEPPYIEHTDTINGWAITRDDLGRVTYLNFFLPVYDPVEKLYNSPSSFDEVKHLFPLSEGNEIRLSGEGEDTPFEGLPEFKQYHEDYTQYYKGVRVQSWTRFNYFITPEGKRMSYAFIGPFIDIKDLEATPHLSEQDARQVLADYLKVDRDDSWLCELFIREFSSKENGTIVRTPRLVYLVYGPYAPGDPNIRYIRAPQYMALIDAHTGELISIST